MYSNIAIFSTDSKFFPVSNFIELHALTLAACSYVVLFIGRRVFTLPIFFFTVSACGHGCLLTAVAK